MNIGFIGCGNMAKALISGIKKAKITENGNIYCSAKNHQKLRLFCAQEDICYCSDNRQTLVKSDIIVLCVKPQILLNVLSEIKEQAAGKLFISIAAGKTISAIESIIGKQKIIRVMPNLNAQIGMSESALCANEMCESEDILCAQKMFESIGNVYEIEEKDFSAFSAVACCSPAFSFMYVDALAQAGIKRGLEKDIAYRCAANSVKASAQMLMQSSQSPQTLIECVCSPGGTTIEGVTKLRENGFCESVDEAVGASYNKDKIL